MSTDISPVTHATTLQERKLRYGHEGAVIWLTGLSASGKSSLSMALEQALCARGYACYVLDGDNLRKGLNSNLGFSPQERSENIRRAGEVAALLADAGLISICAFISPYSEDRARARQACIHAFHEVYLAADLATCEARDTKGLYQKARARELPNFTGISAPYEPPKNPDLILNTAQESLSTSLEVLLSYVIKNLPLEELSHP